MKHSVILLLLIFLFGGATQLSAQEYDEHDKEQLRKFLRQERNFEVVGLTVTDTLSWNSSEEWLSTISSGDYRFVWTSVDDMLYLRIVGIFNSTDLSGSLILDDCKHLSQIQLYGAELDEISAQNCKSLLFTKVIYSSLNKLKIINCPTLNSIEATDALLDEVRISNNENLKGIHVYNNDKMSVFDLQNLPNLVTLKFSNNNIETIDVSGFTKLRSLDLHANKLFNIDLQNNTELETLNLANNKLTEINLSQNKNIDFLDLQSNAIVNLDLSNNNLIQNAFLAGNQLSQLDMSKQSELYSLNISSNKFTFRELQILKNTINPLISLDYSSQANIIVSKDQELSRPFDLEYAGAETIQWYYKDTKKPLKENIDYTISNGITTFNKVIEDSIYCKLTHSNFPDLNLTSSCTTIFIEGHVFREKEKEKIRTFLRQNDNLSTIGLSLNDSTTWYKSEEWLNKVEGIKWTRSSPHYISEIHWNNKDWSFAGEFILSKCDSLTSIEINGAKIDSIVLSQNPTLINISLSNNNLQKINLSYTPNLKNLEISHNKLTSIDIPEIENADQINLSYNNLQSVFIPNKTLANANHIDISNNKLDFNRLKYISTPETLGKITYAPQQIFKIAPRLIRGHNQISIFGYECNVKWLFKDKTPVDPSHYEQPWVGGGGSFRFKTELKDSIYCQITHPSFPDLTLKTTNTVVRIMSFQEDTKELFRNFLRQGKNMEILGVMPTDTLDWYDLSNWMHLKSIKYYMYGDTYAVGMQVDWTTLNGQLEGDLDFTNYLDIDYFKAKNHKFKSLKFPNNKIMEIDVQNCNLEEINIEDCTRLTDLNLSDNKLSKIKTENNIALVRAYLNNNKLEDADFAKGFSNVKILEINNNLISEADMSMNTSIQQLRMANNQLTNINLSNSTIYNLDLSNNKLSTLDLSRYTYLYEVKAANNQLKEIKHSPNFINPYAISSWENNNLSFNHLPPTRRIPNDPLVIFTYSPQSQIQIEPKINDSIDLKYTGGKEFIWMTTNEFPLTNGEDYIVENGVSKFTKKITNELYCLITNSDYPKLTLYTTSTKITNDAQSIEASTLENEVNVYSNTTAELTLVAPVDAKYTVYNLSGEAVAQGNILKSEETISTPSGIYLVRVETNEGTVNRKVIVK